MKLKTSIIGIILIIMATSGCTGNNGQLNDTNSGNDSSTFLPATNINSRLSNEKPLDYDTSGLCTHVADGDTIDVDGVGRIRLVGINTPEKDQYGYREAKSLVKKMCLGKIVYLDIDDAKYYDKYGRVLAVVYVGKINMNAELLKREYARIMFIPPSEFDPYSWI